MTWRGNNNINMSTFLPKSIQALIQEFSRLPGIGPKTAQRLALHLLRTHKGVSDRLGDAVLNLKKGVMLCQECQNLTTENPCKICVNVYRDKGLVCVVEDVMDLIAIEKTGEYKGQYHVLHGVIAPMEGMGPEELKIRELIDKIKRNSVKEVILATNPSMEGETTAMYLAKLLKKYPVKVTRIARGLPVGGDLEYADDITVTRAMEGRREY